MCITLYHTFEKNFNLRITRGTLGILSFQVARARAQLQLKDLVCNASMLRQFLTVDEGATLDDLQTQLCNQPPAILREAERLFLSQLDFSKFSTVRISDITRAISVVSHSLSPPFP